MAETRTAGPVGERERIEDLDILRGFALFGVFLVNMIEFAGPGIMATGAQLGALPRARIDEIVTFGVKWLAGDKANTLFAFLFGLGFTIQMDRAQARGARFETLYLRRLTVLLGFGIFHAMFLWAWDILHLYALAGFVLFALRRLPARAMLAGAIALILFDPHLQELVTGALGLDFSGDDAAYADAAVLARQAAGQSGDYWAVWRQLNQFNLYDWILNFGILGWLIYALGRFLAGAWVGRQGWLQHADSHLAGFRRVFRIALPLGLAFALLARILEAEILGEGSETIGQLLRAPAAAVLAIGYLCGIVLARRTPIGGIILAPLGDVGRMALTNYVTQSLIYGLLLFGVGPGLALAGQIGSLWLTLIVIACFLAQIAFSRVWLRHFLFGPLEYCWRALTYWELPPFRRRGRRAIGAADS